MSGESLNIPETYSSLKKQLGIKIKESPRLKELVNFKINEKTPVHRWYYFKEGYSHQLVEKVLNEFHIKEGSTVLDPFAGSGTTLLTCQWKGIYPIGVDINPFFVFVERVKLDWYKYNLKKLKEEIQRFSEISMNAKPSIEPPELSSFRRVYTKEALNGILLLKEIILEVEDSLIKNLLLLGLASILEDVSKIKKEGKGLKFKKKMIPPVKETFIKKLKEMYVDINHLKNFFKVKMVEGEALRLDVRDISLDFIKKNEPVDLIMFSPPYLNTFDYTEVYKLELWFLDFVKNYYEFKALRKKTLRSHNLVNWRPTKIWECEVLDRIVGEIQKRELWSEIIPVMIRGYFDDMFLSMKKLHEVLKSGAYCVIVVGNSSYANIPVPTDLLLAKVAEDAEFKPIEIRIARQLVTSSQQLRKMKSEELRKYLRESIIILKNT